MERTVAKSPRAKEALALIEKLQKLFVDKLESISQSQGESRPFTPVDWLRDEGTHGGGRRFVAPLETLFNRGSVNMSQVHYDDLPDKPLASATALSTIIHPHHPRCPSVHMHYSWTELKNGRGYWRVMADLNPSISDEIQKLDFEAALKGLAGDRYEEGSEQGEKYFYIPALGRHRGVSHFYLEGYSTDDFEKDRDFVEFFATGMIHTYCLIFEEALKKRLPITKEDQKLQQDYHTLYFYQVLTLDRGTTSGLMIHKQNDVGTLGSLPSHVNRELLSSWQDQTEHPQNHLVGKLVEQLSSEVCEVTEELKERLAGAIRDHYTEFPGGLDKQARGDTLPTTVSNHGQDKD